MSGSLEYAQARIQARLPRHPNETLWRRLAAAHSLRHYLEDARATPMAPWVADLSGASAVHDLEQALRSRLLAAVQELALWLPGRWREAVLHLRWLPYLPALGSLLAGDAAHPWMRDEPWLRPYLADTAAARKAALAGRQGGFLVRASEQGGPLPAAWVDAWRERWPRGRAHARGLAELLDLVQAHRADFAQHRAARAWEARAALREHTRRLFRRHALEPAAAFAYALMLALDLERLRADLVRLALFAEPQEHA